VAEKPLSTIFRVELPGVRVKELVKDGATTIFQSRMLPAARFPMVSSVVIVPEAEPEPIGPKDNSNTVEASALGDRPKIKASDSAASVCFINPFS
jgi:hypothetical protein